MNIGMVGSRKLTSKQCDEYRELARQLALAGYTIVSGGCLQGADQAAYEGAIKAGASPILMLDKTHKPKDYPGAEIILPENTPGTQHYDVAWACADEAQRRSQHWPHFMRNGAIALWSDVVIAWRQGDSRGTNHTLACAKYLERPRIILDRNPSWQDANELSRRVLAALEKLSAK